jgi:hypothetical protein
MELWEQTIEARIASAREHAQQKIAQMTPRMPEKPSSERQKS